MLKCWVVLAKVGGCSAGGLTVYLHLDYIRRLMPQHVPRDRGGGFPCVGPWFHQGGANSWFQIRFRHVQHMHTYTHIYRLIIYIYIYI